MRTSITLPILETEMGRQADAILRNCVHCGFCNATCPTYQLTGDELDGPRGRIYLIKQVLEGHDPGAHTQLHLDRCLTCRNCETTCPSGVHYSRLLDTGRQLVEQAVRRPFAQRFFRTAIRSFLLSPLFGLALTLGRTIRPLMPATIRRAIPARNKLPSRQTLSTQSKKILLIQGCVQKSLQPSIDIAAANVFNSIGVQAINTQSAGCCGALSHHLGAEQDAIARIRQNIDTWLALMEQEDIETITMTASGCGVMLRDYRHLLEHDSDYANKARRISDAYRDPIEIITSRLAHSDSTLHINNSHTPGRIAFHSPCTLQHGQQIRGQIEGLLTTFGFELVPFADSHLCCGSAGTYALTQKSMSQTLLKNKVTAIEVKKPDMIVTANIGCQTHLQSGTDLPVRHWLELFA